MTHQGKKKRVVSGMRPTGRLHIGHYFGALQNWVALQNDPAYQCFYFIADWHALTSDYADSSAVAQNTIEIVTDYLASGLDPNSSTIFLQSLVPEHAELHLLLSMVTPLGWLERVPTYKEQLENISNKDLHTYGFLGYPVLQTADIVIYSEEGTPLFVPVGEDQVSHVELSREIVRRFNLYFGQQIREEELSNPQRQSVALELYRLLFPDAGPASTITVQSARRMIDTMRKAVRESGLSNFVEKFPGQHALFSNFVRAESILTEPGVMLTETPRIPGTDGRKMSKSYGNAIMLSESDEDIWGKVRPMKTDPARKRRSDPGNPDVCPVYDWHKLFSPPETLKWSAEGCRTAGIGCIECKRAMADNLIRWIAPVRERRIEYEKHPSRVLEVIEAGSHRARLEAQKTMQRVREAVFGWDTKRKEIASESAAKA